MKNKGKDGIIKGAFSLGVGAFISKLLGAIYRVPLTNLIGGYGLGLYQMVFPVYTLLLDFSGASVPSALSKIISSYKGEEKRENGYLFLQTAIRLFCVIGIVFSLGLAIFSKGISTLQGNSNAFLPYIFLAPSIILVCLISCYRGYFQGLMNMNPTAISQILEQLVKLGLGLLFAKIFMPNVALAVAGATFAITISEFVALIYLKITYSKSSKGLRLNIKYVKEGFFGRSKYLIKFASPIIVVGLMIPLSHVIDSFLIVNILSRYTKNATILYGLLSGVAHTVISLPVSICYGISAVVIPSVSSANTQEEKQARSEKSLLLTLLITVPCALVCYFGAPLIIRILFRSLSLEEGLIASNLLRMLSPCVILLSVVQTQNSILIANNKLYFPSVSLGIGIIAKTVVDIALLNKPEFNIYGGAIGIITCYFSACLINLSMIILNKVKNESSTFAIRQLNN